MTEEERERALRALKGKTIMETTLLHEDDEGFNDVITLRFSDMTRISFTLHGSMEEGLE